MKTPANCCITQESGGISRDMNRSEHQVSPAPRPPACAIQWDSSAANVWSGPTGQCLKPTAPPLHATSHTSSWGHDISARHSRAFNGIAALVHSSLGHDHHPLVGACGGPAGVKSDRILRGWGHPDRAQTPVHQYTSTPAFRGRTNRRDGLLESNYRRRCCSGNQESNDGSLVSLRNTRHSSDGWFPGPGPWGHAEGARALALPDAHPTEHKAARAHACARAHAREADKPMNKAVVGVQVCLVRPQQQQQQQNTRG